MTTNAEYLKKHYAANKKYYYDRNVRRRDECRDLVAKAKEGKSCTKCLVQYPPYVLDFHHRDPSQKVSEICTMIKDTNLAKLPEEIAKWDLVCANCHREIEFGAEEAP